MQDPHPAPTEASPLLQHLDSGAAPVPEAAPVPVGAPGPAGPAGPGPISRQPWLLIPFLAFNIFCSAAAGSLVAVPITKLLEDNLCRRHYARFQDGAGAIDERLCKVEQVQSQLAWLTGALDSFEAVVGVIVALPYGVLADRYATLFLPPSPSGLELIRPIRIGRRPVFALSSLGTLLTLAWNAVVLRFSQRIPLYLILLAPALQVIGGGESVLLAMNYSIAADVVPPATRADSFLRMAVASHIGRFVASSVSARLMQTVSPWPPILIAFVLIPLGAAVILFIPETLQVQKHDPERHHQPAHTTCAQTQTSLLARGAAYLRNCLSRLGRALSIIKSPSALFVLLTFISASPVSLGAGTFIVQYVSKRFGWSFADAAYLRSVKGISDMIVLLIALPALSLLLMSPSMPFRLSPLRKDLILARLSMLLMTCGTLLMAGGTVQVVIAGQLIITLGDGFISLCRSVMTSFVDNQHASTLYTLISIVETVGSCAAGPALAWLFSTGMKLGNGWEGLPYVGISALCALMTLLLLFVRVAAEARRTGAQEED
ncbi:Uncharacterized protein TPAR_00264 [Tolypocladium paradoxum]|uniref:Major facilitator superfamily (MFS) profile domain-containing protein n=1 Tax=Tolypocladium paradoxum TaxID=94208 RepID=A0A2S4LAR3_9HYPO|nr:Uncharacterized protein TPAR_00264 [Tolypocladium paradoxum]